VLGLFENPLNVKVLRAHAAGPLRLAELQELIGWSAEATVRGAIKNLQECAGLVKQPAEGKSNAVATELGPAGRDLLTVAEVLEGWLSECPSKPIELEGEHAAVAVKALAGGWSSSLMRALATGPSTLTELSERIPEISYPALERRIGWMKTTGQIDALPKQPRGVPYTPTRWLRRAITPLAMAMRCERRHMVGNPPITDVEVEAAFLLALQVAPLPKDRGGTCALAVQTDAIGFDEGQPLAGVNLELQPDGSTSWSVGLMANPRTWVIGAAEDWLNAMLDGRFEILRIGGADPQFAADTISAMRYALFID
jgi:DNA-binding HxlR family transcriptional regulator